MWITVWSVQVKVIVQNIQMMHGETTKFSCFFFSTDHTMVQPSVHSKNSVRTAAEQHQSHLWVCWTNFLLLRQRFCSESFVYIVAQKWGQNLKLYVYDAIRSALLICSWTCIQLVRFSLLYCNCSCSKTKYYQLRGILLSHLFPMLLAITIGYIFLLVKKLCVYWCHSTTMQTVIFVALTGLRRTQLLRNLSVHLGSSMRFRLTSTDLVV